MFKISNRTFNQQRAVLKPLKHNTVYEEEEEEEDDMINEEDDLIEDGSSSCYSSGIAITSDTRNETMLLAQFLSSTGPEEYATAVNMKGDNIAQQQFKRASRLLSKLRKRPTMPVLRSGPTKLDHIPLAPAPPSPPPIRKNHVPLPVFEQSNNHDITHSPSKEKGNIPPVPPIKISHLNHSNNNNNKSNKKSVNMSANTPLTAMQLRDSGIYSETNSERDFSVISSTTTNSVIPPLPLFLNDLQQFPQPPQTKSAASSQCDSSSSPRRPAPMPPALASAAIAACSPSSVCSTTNTLRSVPEAALKRRSVRLRHVQVQTEIGTQTNTPWEGTIEAKSQLDDKQACPHCRQVVSGDNLGRIRRPSCPPALSSGPALLSNEEQTDAKQLLAMINSLKSQLAEEKQCRIKLEKAMYQRQSDDRRDALAKEKDKWAGDCLWLNDRIALLPE